MAAKDTLIRGADGIGKGDGEAVPGKGDAGRLNNPDKHFDIHKNKRRYYDIEKSPAAAEVFDWQRDRLKTGDQGAAGYPLNIIIDPAMREMYQHVNAQGLTNVFDRWVAQEEMRCSFCAQGLSCQLCAQGPCRIGPKVPRGACGADAHVMVARNFVYRHVTIGTAANIFHAEQAARILRAAAQSPESGLKIRDEGKLLKYAEMAGLDSKQEIGKVALDLTAWIMTDMGRPYYEEAKIVQVFAPEKRKELWRKLKLFPGGGNSEVVFAQAKCVTNLNGDPADFLLTALRLGIINQYQGLFALDILQEILMGTQKIHKTRQNMGLLDPAKINIVANGHMPFVAQMVTELASSGKWREMACQAGAESIQVLGHVCEGQQLISYEGTQSMSAFGGQAGEWLSEEYLLATGCVDVFLFDYNCTVPTLPLYAKRFGTTMIGTHEVIRLPDTEAVEFIPEKMREQAEKVLAKSITAFKRRKAEKREICVPPYTAECMAGFSTESVKAALGGAWEPLLEAIRKGFIRGLATVVGCTTALYGQGGSNVFRIAQGLIARDILVLSGGCTSAVMEYSGLARPEAVEECGPGLKSICQTLGIPPVFSYGACGDIGKMIQTAKELADSLGVDTNMLPLVIGAPEYLGQKAVADACAAVAQGWLVHIAPVPSVTGSEVVVKTLTETTETLGLGKFMFELNADKAVQLYSEHIERKRRDLGI